MQEMKSRKIRLKMRKTGAHLNAEGRKEVTGRERLQIQERGSPKSRTGQDRGLKGQTREISEPLVPPTSTSEEQAEACSSFASWVAFLIPPGNLVMLSEVQWTACLPRLSAHREQSREGITSMPLIHLTNIFTMCQTLCLEGTGDTVRRAPSRVTFRKELENKCLHVVMDARKDKTRCCDKWI